MYRLLRACDDGIFTTLLRSVSGEPFMGTIVQQPCTSLLLLDILSVTEYKRVSKQLNTDHASVSQKNDGSNDVDDETVVCVPNLYM